MGDSRALWLLLYTPGWALEAAETQPLPITAIGIFQIAKFFGNNPQVVIP